MKISDDGLKLICDFEGYHRALPNGDCTTYRCPANVLTIGYGCTVGITEGMVWTKQQAQDAFRSELAKHETAVNRLSTVDMTQGQFDALASFSYNCGESALAHSTVLRCMNAGDNAGAARAFGMWNKGGGRVLPGLVRRRAAEAALFLKPDAAVAAVTPDMPQLVDAPLASPAGSRKMAAASTGEATGAAAGLATLGLSMPDLLGYSDKGLALIKAYGLPAAIVAAFAFVAIFAAIKHFTRQDHAEGRYVPREASS